MTTKAVKFPEEYDAVIYYSGVFDYEKLMKTIAGWFGEMGYEFHEDVYKHKVPSPAGSEQEFKLSGWRKVTEYIKFWIRVNAHIWELKEIDVLINGEKKKMAKGKMQMTFKCQYDLDYNNKFNTPATEKLQNFLELRVWNKMITGGWEDELYYRMYKLHQKVKQVLNMSTPTNASRIRY